MRNTGPTPGLLIVLVACSLAILGAGESGEVAWMMATPNTPCATLRTVAPARFRAHKLTDNEIVQVRDRHVMRIQEDPAFRYLIEEAVA